MASNNRPSEAEASPAGITILLLAWRDGDAQAGERLIAILYRELHAMAQRR